MFCFGTQLVGERGTEVFLFGLCEELGQVKSKHAVSCLVLTIITVAWYQCCYCERRRGRVEVGGFCKLFRVTN